MPKVGAEQEIIYEGIPASPGIAIAPVHVIARGFSAPEIYEIGEDEVEREQERFLQALEITKRQLVELQSRLEDLSGDNESGIFEAHVMILEDRSVVDKVLQAISRRLQNAEYAFYAIMQNFLEAMRRDPGRKDIRVVVLSGWGDGLPSRRLTELGVGEVFLKGSVDLSRLLEAIA